jgi:hypothetical protein
MNPDDERKKLVASFLNMVGAGFLTTGILGPLATFLYSKIFEGTDPTLIVAGSIICLFMGVCLHLIGQSVFGASS